MVNVKMIHLNIFAMDCASREEFDALALIDFQKQEQIS